MREYQRYGGSKTEREKAQEKQIADGDVCVWEVFNRDLQEVFVIADGYPDYLQEPGPALVYRERFYPWVPILFNEGDLPEDEIYPQSDVMLLIEMQDEHNQAKQGLREHRRANMPIYLAPQSAFTDENEIFKITELPAFGIAFLKAMQQGTKPGDLISPLKKAQIEPALYDTSGIMMDLQLISGSQEANLGPTSGATATESSIAESSRAKSTNEDSDGLDGTLGHLAHEVAQMVIDGIDEQFVKATVGEGALWPQLDRKMLADQLEISVRAGSSGMPNQAFEAAKLERATPLLLQLPEINRQWLAEKVLTLVDEGIDTAEALVPSLPSITTQNQIDGAQPNARPAGETDAEGADEGPQPAFGDSGNETAEQSA